MRHLPIATIPLTQAERAEVRDALRTLVLDLAAPGDYGHDSRLGRLLRDVAELRGDLESAPTAEPMLVGG